MDHLPQIHIKVIPQSEQRYDTWGDYWQNPDGSWEFRISEKTPQEELALLIHELYEAVTVALQGIPFEEIDAFDAQSSLDDPGDDPKAPYHQQHMQALDIEKRVAELLAGSLGKQKEVL